MGKKKKKKSSAKTTIQLSDLWTKISNLIEEYPLRFLAGLTILAYSNILFNGFVWDDEEQIVNNSIIHSLKNIGAFLYGGTFNTGGTNELSGWFFRPLINITFASLYSIFELNAWGYHLFSLAFHMLNVWLVFKILSYFSEINKKKNLFPVLIAAIFAVHTGILEAVSYIAAVGDLMVTTASLASVFLILKYKNSEKAKYPLIMSLIILTGLLYKESAFAILPILISFLLIFKKIILNLKTWVALIIIPYVAYFLMRIPIAAKQIQSPHYSPISEASLSERLITIPKILTHYLEMFFYPHNLSVSQHFIVNKASSMDFYIPLIIVIGILTGLFYFYKKAKSSELEKKILFFGFLWSLFSFGLISNIIPLDMTVADRWFYFPIIGLIIISYVLLNNISENHHKYFYGILIGYALILTSLSFERNLNWRSGLTLYSNDIKVNPESFDLNNNVGVELFRVGKIDEAKYHFEKSINLQPKWIFPRNNLGVIYDQEGDYQKAEELFKGVLEVSDYHLAHVNLCRLYTVRTKNFDQAEKTCGEAAQKLPNNLQLWFYLAIAKYENGKQTEALEIAQALAKNAPSQETQYLYEKISKKEKLEF